jgi:hypothetical protein
VFQAIRLLDFALSTSESYLPSPEALHALIVRFCVNFVFLSDLCCQYELVRSSSVLRKQATIVNTSKPNGGQDVKGVLDHLLNITDFYAKKIEEKGVGVETTQNVMQVIADEIEANGMHGVTAVHVVPPMQV